MNNSTLVSVYNIQKPVTGTKNGEKVHLDIATIADNPSNSSIFFEGINQPQDHFVDKVPYLSSAKDMTTSFADINGEISTKSYNWLLFFITLSINSSNDFRLKFLGKHTSGGSREYKIDHNKIECCAISVSSASGEEDSYIEFNNDQNDLYAIKVPINGIPIIQPQACVVTLGATAAQIDEAFYTLSY